MDQKKLFRCTFSTISGE